MIRVGITGGIGSGKSTVCRLFAMLGVAVYDSDMHARLLMNNDAQLVAKIVAILGVKAYCGGTLNRAYVASRVFNDADLLAQLNAVVHPAVGVDFERWAAARASCGDAYVLLESAILLECGFDRYVDKSIAVCAPEQLRIDRTVARDGVSSDAVRDRIAAQWSDEQRAKLADYVIYNDDISLVTEQVLMLHKLFSDESRSCGC